MKLTQGEMARRLSITRSTYAGYEGNKLPNMKPSDFIEHFAAALEISPAELIDQADLWQYNLIPAARELSLAQRHLIAAVSHLDEDQITRLAEAVRLLFPPPIRS